MLLLEVALFYTGECVLCEDGLSNSRNDVFVLVSIQVFIVFLKNSLGFGRWQRLGTKLFL